jgi:transcriptional regulator with XRE-family HTH domain
MNIRELRELSGMTQQAFGDYFGIPLRTIQNWEGGQRKCPDYLLDLIEYKLKKEKESIYLIYKDSMDDACVELGYIASISNDEADKYCYELNKDNEYEYQDYDWMILDNLSK